MRHARGSTRRCRSSAVQASGSATSPRSRDSHAAWVVARTDCRLLRVPRAQIVRLTETDPEVWRSFSLLLARTHAKAMGIIHALKQSDPARRVAAMLAVLVEDNAAGMTIAPASQWDIGELAHLGRSKVNTSLKALESRGLIRRRYGAIEVVDADGLRRLVHEGRVRPKALGPSRYGFQQRSTDIFLRKTESPTIMMSDGEVDRRSARGPAWAQ
jgi:Crp-like helix-turn-helix domain